MNELRGDQIGLLVAGSGLVVGGSTLAGVYAFADRVGVVFVGFLLFAAGYRVAQHGQYRDPGDPLVPVPSGSRGASAGGPDGPQSVESERDEAGSVESERDDGSVAAAGRYGLQAVGLFGIAFGVTLFAQTIVTRDPETAVVAGVCSIGGYMCAHVGINGSLL